MSPLLYGSGKPLRTPGWVTGSETPTQRDRRYREIQEALDNNERREEERRLREQFTQLEHQAEIKLSPPSPPREEGAPVFDDPFIETGEEPLKLGSYSRLKELQSSFLTEYEDIFGLTPDVDSRGRLSAEFRAHEFWRNEQANTPDDIIDEREARIERLVEFGLPPEARPAPEGVSKYDILLADLRDELVVGWLDKGVPIKGVGRGKVSETQARGFAVEAIDEWVKDLEGVAREQLGKDTSDQDVREWVYYQLSVQRHVSDVLDEWGFPQGLDWDPPIAAQDEAVRRAEAEMGDIFAQAPAKTGILEKLTSVFHTKFIPFFDPTVGFQAVAGVAPPTTKGEDVLKFASYDEVHRAGQVFADPVAHFALEAAAIPARGAEIQLETLTGVETTAVSDALRSDLAEDVLSEVISPEFILIALPFVGAGTRGLTGVLKLARIADNLLLTGGAGPALFRGGVGSLRGIFRGLTAFAKNPRVLTQIPENVRTSELFLRGVENIRAVKAGMFGRGLSHEEWNKAIGADSPARLNRVTKDLAQEMFAEQHNITTADNLPLRQAVVEDLSSGRSMEDVIETGLTPRKIVKLEEVEELSDLARFWRGEEGGGPLEKLFQRPDDTVTVDKALVKQATGRHPGVSLHRLRRTVNNVIDDPLPEHLLKRATTSDLMTIAEANKTGVKKTVTAAGTIRKRLQNEAFPELNRLLDESVVTATTTVGKRHRLAAFNKDFTLTRRQKELDKYVDLLGKARAKSTDPFDIQNLFEDQTFAEWAFGMQNVTDFSAPAWQTGSDEVVGAFKHLIKAHRGSNDTRLAKLPGDVADGFKQEVRARMHKLGKLGEQAKKSMSERLLTMRLDLHDAAELGLTDIRFDAGRRMKILIERSGATDRQIEDAFKGITKLVQEGKAPTSEQLHALEATLGPEATKEFMKARKVSEKLSEGLYDALGLPRMLMATWDMSAMLRQGGILVSGHPLIGVSAMADGVRAFFSEGSAIRLDEALKHGRGTVQIGDKTWDLFDLANEMGVYMAPWESGGTVARLLDREEVYATSFASKWGLGVRQSERSYILFLNKIRADVFDNTVRNWVRSGRQPSVDEMKDIAHYINVASGRGKVPKSLEGVMPLLNVTMFSPRLALSRFQVTSQTGKAAATLNRRLSRLIIKDMTAFTGQRIALLEMGSLGGLWDFSLDPTSADFMKVRIGNTSIDPWAGFIPYAVFFARAGQAIAEGRQGDLPELGLRLLRTKLAPIPSGTYDVITGRDFLGKPISWTSIDFDNLILSRMTPLIAQDIAEAWQAGEFKIGEAGLVGGSTFVGFGAATYRRLGEEVTEARNEFTQEKWGIDYSDKEGMDPAKRDLTNADPTVAGLLEERDKDALETGDEWAEERAAEEGELLSIRSSGKTTSGEQILEFTQGKIDELLDAGEIPGDTWISVRAENADKLRAWRQGWQEAQGIDFEEEPAEPGSMQDVINQWWDVELKIDPFTLEKDWDTFFEERDALRAKAIGLESAEGEATKYFEAMGEDDTAMEVRYRKARDQNDVYEALPEFQGGVTRVAVDKILDDVRGHLDRSGSGWGMGRYIQWLYYQGEQYQTKEWAVAYWVAVRQSDEVANPEKAEMVMKSPDLLLFYPGIFRGLTDDAKQNFINRYRGKFLSKELIAAFIETGEFPIQAETGTEGEPFRISALGG